MCGISGGKHLLAKQLHQGALPNASMQLDCQPLCSKNVCQTANYSGPVQCVLGCPLGLQGVFSKGAAGDHGFCKGLLAQCIGPGCCMLTLHSIYCRQACAGMAHRGERLQEQVQQEVGWDAFSQSQTHQASFTETIRDAKLISNIEVLSVRHLMSRRLCTCVLQLLRQEGACSLQLAYMHSRVESHCTRPYEIRGQQFMRSIARQRILYRMKHRHQA